MAGKNERSCLSKRVYWSQGEAAQVAANCTERRGVKLRAYRCSNCRQWHLTKQVAG